MKYILFHHYDFCDHCGWQWFHIMSNKYTLSYLIVFLTVIFIWRKDGWIFIFTVIFSKRRVIIHFLHTVKNGHNYGVWNSSANRLRPKTNWIRLNQQADLCKKSKIGFANLPNHFTSGFKSPVNLVCLTHSMFTLASKLSPR